MRQSSDEEQQCPPTVSHDHAASRLVKTTQHPIKAVATKGISTMGGSAHNFGTFFRFTFKDIFCRAFGSNAGAVLRISR